jgi:leucyl/phenylalanyl-tRNA--protein transferase
LTQFRSLFWEHILAGYEQGIFPMGNEDGTVSWFEANPRAIIPIADTDPVLKIPRSLRQVMKKDQFEIKHNSSFLDVIKHCSDREYTWINELVIKAFKDLHDLGYGHSIEAWREGKLAGGLYGVAYKGAFFGESMFHKENNASKICVVKLFEILKRNKYLLFDIQMMTPHFEALGAIEIDKISYKKLLRKAMSEERQFIFEQDLLYSDKL